MLYRHVSLFNESNDKFCKLDKDCWICMFNVECIVKPSILKAILLVDAISKALVFVKSKDMSILYNCNNPWIMNFNVKVLSVLTPLVKNKHIDVSRYNYFLCITSSNINLCFSFNCLSKLWYSIFSIIMEYDGFMKFSSSRNCDFWFDTLCDWMTKLDYKS